MRSLAVPTCTMEVAIVYFEILEFKIPERLIAQTLTIRYQSRTESS